jgi:hypothetical protein
MLIEIPACEVSADGAVLYVYKSVYKSVQKNVRKKQAGKNFCEKARGHKDLDKESWKKGGRSSFEPKVSVIIFAASLASLLARSGVRRCLCGCCCASRYAGR